MKDIGIIGSSDGPTSIYISDNTENLEKNIDAAETREEVLLNSDVNDILNSRTMGENLDSGVKIMGLGMIAVFGVLTVLYIVIKIMGQFAKSSKDKENEKN